MILVVDKPVGPTSAAVVARVAACLRRWPDGAAGSLRLGHTGTLDPMASGVLVLVGGEATKLATCLVADDKTYEAELQLGAETDTEDAQGAVVRRCPTDAVTLETLRAAARGLVGQVAQVPPMFSALKVGGRRLYDYARAGEVVARAPRTVEVHELEVLDHDPAAARARLRVRCGKGTYVRTLAVRLARDAGSGGHLCALRRVAVGSLSLARAITPDALEQRLAAGQPPPLVAPGEALAGLPVVSLTAELARRLGQGQKLTWQAVPAPAGGSGPATCVLAVHADQLVALLAPPGDGTGRLRILRGFVPPLPLSLPAPEAGPSPGDGAGARQH